MDNLEARRDVGFQGGGRNLASARAANLRKRKPTDNDSKHDRLALGRNHSLARRDRVNNEYLLESSGIRRRATTSEDVAVEVGVPRVQLLEVRRKELVPAEARSANAGRSRQSGQG